MHTRRRRLGIAVSALAVTFMIFDSVIKLLEIGPVQESMHRLGFPAELAPTIGAIELACLVLYLLPRAAVLGAILMTGFLGGAVATHVRVEDPLATHSCFPLYVGALLWLGLGLRHPDVTAIVLGGPRRPSADG